MLVLTAICTFLCRMASYGMILENLSQEKIKDDSCFSCAISNERYALKLNRDGGEKIVLIFPVGVAFTEDFRFCDLIVRNSQILQYAVSDKH